MFVCTMVMKLHKESDMLVAAKTVDTPKTALTFDRKSRSTNRYGFLYFKMGWQKGINSGINEEGLTVLSSYASTGMKLPDPERNVHDTRGIANEYVLSQCSTVHDGLQKLEMVFKEQPSGVGGIHFLMDSTGAMALLEHEPTVTLKKQIVKSDYVIRANEPLLLHNKQKCKHLEWEDRSLRYSQAEAGLMEVHTDNWLEQMKKLLSTHVPKEEQQLGQLCIHDFENTGSRSKDLTIHTTGTALIFDVKNRQLIYSEGPPCNGQWSVLALNK